MPVEGLLNDYWQDGWQLLQEEAKESGWQSTLGIANDVPSDLLVIHFLSLPWSLLG